MATDSKNIFCTWVFGDPQYVIAAITAVSSYREVGGKMQFWCLWANLDEAYVVLLGRHFDRVVEMPILSREMPKYKSERKDAMYGSWINTSFTKWNCFNPDLISPDDAKMVCAIDADVFFVKNPDSIFEAIGPNKEGVMPIGVVCDTPYVLQYNIKQPFVCNYDRSGPRKYRHGEPVPIRQVIDCMKTWRCVPGYIVVFAPNASHWKHFNYFFDSFVPGRTLLGYDEQLLGHIVAAHKIVVNISPGYSWHVGKTKWYSGEIWAKHCAAGHPWLMARGYYEDTIQWWDAWSKMLTTSADSEALLTLLVESRAANQSTIEFNEKTRQKLLDDGKIDKDGKVL